MDYTLIKERIREAIDIETLLEYYGAKISRRSNQREIRSTCPIHGGDGELNFSIDRNLKMWNCYSRGCGEKPYLPTEEQPPRTIFYLIELCEESRRGRPIGFHKVLEIAGQIAGVEVDLNNLDISKEDRDRIDNEKWVKRQKKLNQKNENNVFDESIITEFMDNFHPYLLERNFSAEVVEEFELGYSPTGLEEDYFIDFPDFSGRIIVPIRDDNGNLVGLSGRLATDNKKQVKKYGKYKHMLDFNKSLVLYNFHRAKETIYETGKVILCEGFFDVIRLWSYGIYNVVAVMGSSLIPEQLSLILNSAMEVYICMDGDEAGKESSGKIAQQLYNVSTDAYIINLPDNCDPDNLEAIDFWLAYSEAKKFVPKKIKTKGLTKFGKVI